MGVNNISTVNSSDTFETWRQRTNSVINAVNLDDVRGITSGDGIGITTDSNGNWSIRHSNTVTTGVTFSGNVKILGTATISNLNVEKTTIQITPKIVGLTTGNVVRIDPSLGLTFAKADSSSNAEVLGVVVGQDSTSYTVALGGKIDTTLFSSIFANMVGVAGATLSPGSAYFLSPTVAGGITSIEPQTYGQVSKPVILGITQNAANILPYRGILIEGVTAGITAELDNKIIVQIDYITTGLPGNVTITGGSTSVKPGDPVAYYRDASVSYASGTTVKVIGKLNSSINNNVIILHPNTLNSSNTGYGGLLDQAFLGFVSRVISDDTSGKILIIEIATPGGSISARQNQFDTSFYTGFETGPRGLTLLSTGGSYGFTHMNGANTKFFDLINTKDDGANPTIKVLLSKTQRLDTVAGGSVVTKSTSVTATSITGGSEYDNLLPNGSFTIWQRGITGITGSSLLSYTTPMGPDRWFYVKHNTFTSGVTLNVQQQGLNFDQTEVPGSPRYYVEVSNSFGGTFSPQILNIQRGLRAFQEQDMTISFYAKATSSGATLDVVYNRFLESYASTSEIEGSGAGSLRAFTTAASGITLTTSWAKYTKPIFIDNSFMTGVTDTDEGWFGLGFSIPSNSTTYSIAQVRLDFGNVNNPPYMYVLPEKELEQCKPYYQRSYYWSEKTGSVTSNYNDVQLQLGNLNTQLEYFVKFETPMFQTPTVNVYSPATGQTGDAFNVNAGLDQRYTGGKPIYAPWHSSIQYRPGALSTLDPADNSINTSVTSTSKAGFYVNIKGGAYSLDTLRFHYAADGDFNLNI